MITFQKWEDKSLKWEPAEFSNVTVTWLPEEALWVPDLIVFNMLEHKELLHSVRSPVKVHFNGSVVFSYPAIYTVMCPIRKLIFIIFTRLFKSHCLVFINSQY